jgi:hypothetical protein
MHDNKKRAVSLRLSTADVKRIKRVSQRLGIRDSDVIRYAIKKLLFKLSALSDPAIRGRSLVPLFLEGGADLVHHFDLDAMRLGVIINDGADDAVRVSMEDLHMLAMSGGAGLLPPTPITAAVPATPARPAHELNGHNGVNGSNGGRHSPVPGPVSLVERRVSPVRRYLYDKYLYRADGEGESSASGLKRAD